LTETTEREDARRNLIEAILDNLPAWTVVAMSIGLLYLVWATIEILDRYVGGLPKVTP
jgi:hypothetical protein